MGIQGPGRNKKCSGNCLKMYTIHPWVIVKLRPCMRWRRAILSSPWITNAGTGTNQVEGDCHRSGCARRNCCATTWASTVRIERCAERLRYACTFFVLVVIQTSEFVTSLRRISAIMKRLKSTSMEIYVKGAPEVMFDIGGRDSFPSKLR